MFYITKDVLKKQYLDAVASKSLFRNFMKDLYLVEQ